MTNSRRMAATLTVPACRMVVMKLASQNRQHRLDPWLTEGGEPPHVGPSNAHCTCTEREGLEDVGAAPEAAVDEHRNAPCHALNHFREALDCAAAAIFRTAAVVGDDDAVDAVFGRKRRVLLRDDALDHELLRRHVTEPLDEIPVHVRWPERRDTGDIQS